MKKITIIVLIASVLPISFIEVAQAGIEEAAIYLQSQNENPWVTMALSAVGKGAGVDYLRSTDVSSAIELAAPILAITAVGEDPRTFPETDLITSLKTHYTNGQIGDTATLNDDIFSLLALLSAGESRDDVVVAGVKDYILQNQNSDGGWGFSVGGSSDTNITSATIMALAEWGISPDDAVIQGAVAYLRSAQNADGGFPYDPQGMWGTDSDASSDAWVISAVESINGDISSWAIEGVGGPVEHLLSLQTEGGYFQYQAGTGEDAFTPVTTSYAVVALAGKSYPVRTISYVPPEPPADGPEDNDEEEGDNEERNSGGGGGSAPKKTVGAVAGEITLAGLQTELNRLTVLLAELQAMKKTSSGVEEFIRDLGIGSVGEDVRTLQKYLNNHDFVLALSGPGSRGYETDFFGALTRVALVRFQTARGIVPAVGFLGPITRAHINAHP